MPRVKTQIQLKLPPNGAKLAVNLAAKTQKKVNTCETLLEKT
tara:strand:- start:630 stop:755 length:126 start_codon:yes stop_codon:yes gene_type:complete